MSITLDKELLLELECIVCRDYMSAPIRQCTTGHSICDSCCKVLTKCPLCQNIFTDSRNITLESLALKMKYPCINAELGCKEVLNYENRSKHEANCPTTGQKCEHEGCLWVGPLERLLSHWKSVHTKEVFKERNTLHVNVGPLSVNIMQAYNKTFWVKYKTVNEVLHISVQFIGNPEKAKHFFYRVETCRFGADYSFHFSDICKSIEINSEVLFRDENCVQVPLRFLKSNCHKDSPEKLIVKLGLRRAHRV